MRVDRHHKARAGRDTQLDMLGPRQMAEGGINRRQHGAGVTEFRTISRLMWLGELQKLVRQSADTLHLLFDQLQLGRDRIGRMAQHHTQHLDIAQRHRQRIIDLMRDTGGHLADGGKLFRQHQLLRRPLQLAVGGKQIGGPRLDPLVEIGVQAAQLAVSLLQQRQQPVEMAGETQDFIGAGRLWPALKAARAHVPGLDPRQGAAHCLERLKDTARPDQEQRHGQKRHRQKGCGGDGGIQTPRGGIGRLGNADIDHAQLRALPVGDRLIGRYIPVIHHIGGVMKALAADQHLLAHICGRAGADRPGAAGRSQGGGDADIIEKQRGDAAIEMIAQLGRQTRAGSGIDQPIDLIDEIVIAVQKQTAAEPHLAAAGQLDAGRRPDNHAAGLIAATGEGDAGALRQLWRQRRQLRRRQHLKPMAGRGETRHPGHCQTQKVEMQLLALLGKKGLDIARQRLTQRHGLCQGGKLCIGLVEQMREILTGHGQITCHPGCQQLVAAAGCALQGDSQQQRHQDQKRQQGDDQQPDANRQPSWRISHCRPAPARFPARIPAPRNSLARHCPDQNCPE